MPLESTGALLRQADAGGYAVPAFNCYNSDTVLTAVRAAEKLGSPVIIQIYSRLFAGDNARMVALAARDLGASSPVPVALSLDHGACEREVIQAFRAGATGVMIDGSTLPFEENMALTKRVVEWAGWIGVSVEGELGHVGAAVNSDEADTSQYTEPSEAARFAKGTGVDCLAVMVGSAHGVYRSLPKLDIERIRAIKAAAGIPLVLHGGSGIPDDEIRKAIGAGIRKINVATDICGAFLAPFKGLPENDPVFGKALDQALLPSREQAGAFLEDRITVFGSAGQAGGFRK